MARRTYTKEQALAALAAAPDHIARFLGVWRNPDGSLGELLTREDCRQGLLSGATDPTDFMYNLAMMKWVQSDSFERDLDAATDRKRRDTLQVVDGETSDKDG
jgi:hypothetical protein